jgi:hypothetical protein
MAGTSGGYTLRPKEKLPKSQTSIKIPTLPPTVVGPGAAAFPFAAKRNSLFSGKVAALVAGLAIEASDFTGPNGSILAKPGVSGAIVVAPGGASMQVTSAPLAAFGDYVFTVGATAGSGAIKGSFKVKPPRTRATIPE